MTDWREDLGSFLDTSDKKRRADQEGDEWARFIADVVMPAFEEVAGELEKHGRTATIRNSVTSAQILVASDGEEEIMYRIQSKTMPDRVLPYAEIRSRERKGRRYLRSEGMLRPATPAYTLADVTTQEIIKNLLGHYMRRVENA